MMNVNQKYGNKRKAREKDRLNIEIKYKEGLLFLKNEEVDEYMEICNLVHEGELNYPLHQGIRMLGVLVRERDELVEEIRDLKRELEGDVTIHNDEL